MSDVNPVEPQPETPKIVGYCRSCGKPLDELSVRNAHGTIYCEEHIPMQQQTVPPIPIPAAAPESPYASPYTAPVPPPIANHDASPGLAFILGLIPGVGAIYNGQYAKGLVHVIIIGLTISVLSNNAARGFEPLVGLLLGSFFFYMAFEAYHTALRRQRGLVVDEFSSLFPIHGGANKFPVAPILLIVLGVIFLLNNLDFFEVERVIRYWPVLLIGLGIYMLYVRMSHSSETGSSETSSSRSGSAQ
jgi:cell wall-active antibiotic response 4TMS protein YvqF